MTETMMNEAANEQAAEVLDAVLSEPENDIGPEESGEDYSDNAAEAAARMVPLATFLGMRDEAKAVGAENAELKRIITMMQQPQMPQPPGLPPQPEGIPDPATDPAGYAQYMAMLENQAMQAEVQQAHEQLSFVESSLDAAKGHLGGKSFQEAYEVARANPQIAKEVLLHPSPGEALVALHHQLQHFKYAVQNPAGMARNSWAPPQAAPQPHSWQGAAPYQQAFMPAPLPSLAGARGGNASALAPLLSDDPIDDLLK